MKKRFYLLILAACTSIDGFSQIPSQIQAKRGVFTERLFLTDRWIDRISPNIFSDDSTSDFIIPTAKAVADYIRSQTFPNFANADLTLTEDRYHHGGGYNLKLDSFRSFEFNAGYNSTSFHQTLNGFKFAADDSLNPNLDFNLINLPLSSDVTNNKPVGIDDNGKLYRMSTWPGGGEGAPQPQHFAQTSTVTISGTTSEASIIGSGTGSLAIPASAWVPGKSYRVAIYGTYSTNNSTPAYITLRLKIGNTTVATAASVLYVGAASQFSATVNITCRATGSSGNIFAFGTFIRNSGVFNWNNGVDASGTVVTPAIDLTTDQAINVTAQLSDASAGNAISSYIVTLEEIN